MINQLILCGRISSVTSFGFIMITNVIDSKDNHHDVPIPITIAPSMMDNILEYCKVGDVVGVKGCLDINDKNRLIVRGDKISFLASKGTMPTDLSNDEEDE